MPARLASLQSVTRHVGLPEAQLNLAQAVVHLATARKSNRTALGICKAVEDLRSRPPGPAPHHLRDAHYRSAERIGHVSATNIGTTILVVGLSRTTCRSISPTPPTTTRPSTATKLRLRPITPC